MMKVKYSGFKDTLKSGIKKYTLYVSTQKGKQRKWAGESYERAEIDSRLNRYCRNNDYVSALIIYDTNERANSYHEEIRYAK